MQQHSPVPLFTSLAQTFHHLVMGMKGFAFQTFFNLLAKPNIIIIGLLLFSTI